MLATIWVPDYINDKGSISLKFFTVGDEIRREMLLLRGNVHCESIRATCEQENQCDCLKTKSEKRHFYRTAAICRPGYPICCNNTHISAKFDHWEGFPSEKFENG